MKKRIVTFLLLLCVCFSLLPTTAGAADKKTVSLKDFSGKTNLNYDQYNALRTGKIDAVKENDTWFYTFESDKLIVKVPVKAFTGKVEMDYSDVNKTLTDNFMKGSGDATPVKTLVYKKRISKKSFSEGGGYDEHKIYICNLSVNFRKETNQTMIARCQMNGQIEFTYRTICRKKITKVGYKYWAPKTADDYRMNLQRKNLDSLPHTVTPKFQIEITQPGTSKVYLNSYRVCGMGKQAKNLKDIRGKITDIKTIAKMADDIIKMPVTPFKSGIDLIANSIEFSNAGKEYNSGASIDLSTKKHKVTEATFISPLPLDTYKDWVQFEIILSDLPTKAAKGKTATKVAVKFWVD